VTEAEWRAKLREDLSRDGLPQAEAAVVKQDLLARFCVMRPLGMASWYAKHPPAGIVVFKKLPIRGWYNRAAQIIAVCTSYPDVFDSFCHEWAHRLHHVEFSRVDPIIKAAFGRVKVPGCAMAAKGPDEMFAEGLTARLTYYKDRFDMEYPIEAQCIIDVLAAVGIA
jgi:hypothetical protein